MCPDIVYEEDTMPILERLVTSVNRPTVVVSEVGIALGRGVADPDELLGASIDSAGPFDVSSTISIPRRRGQADAEDTATTD